MVGVIRVTRPGPSVGPGRKARQGNATQRKARQRNATRLALPGRNFVYVLRVEERLYRERAGGESELGKAADEAFA